MSHSSNFSPSSQAQHFVHLKCSSASHQNAEDNIWHCVVSGCRYLFLFVRVSQCFYLVVDQQSFNNYRLERAVKHFYANDTVLCTLLFESSNMAFFKYKLHSDLTVLQCTLSQCTVKNRNTPW